MRNPFRYPIQPLSEALPNGLRMVSVELPHLHTVSLVLYVRVGSRYESADENGLSHFLEHMLFRGTASYPSSLQLHSAIEDIGGTLYAETGRDYSLYQISVHPENVERGLALLGEVFRAPTLADIELERKIVLEEIQEDLDEQGRDVNIDDIARRAVWPDHPLGFKITGPYENVERFTDADVQRHFARHYVASNMVLAVSGAARHAQTLGWAVREFGELPAGTPTTSPPPDDRQRRPQLAYVRSEGSQTALQVVFRALPETDPDFIALQALARVLDDGMSTRLHYRVCDQKGLAYNIHGNLEAMHDVALLEVNTNAVHKNVAAVLDEVLAILGDLRTTPVPERELERAKKRFRWDLEAAFDDPDALAGWYAGTELFRPSEPAELRLARMEAVTSEDILRAARRVMRPEGLTVAAVGVLSSRVRGELRRKVEAF